MKSTRFSREGLVVRLSCGRDCVSWFTLDKTDWGQYQHVPVSMGVDILRPGTHEYKCVDDGGRCEAPPERPTMTLETTAISYFLLRERELVLLLERRSIHPGLDERLTSTPTKIVHVKKCDE